MVSAFEGNKAETKTMLPVIESFMAAHDLPDVTIIAVTSPARPSHRVGTEKGIQVLIRSFSVGGRIVVLVQRLDRQTAQDCQRTW